MTQAGVFVGIDVSKKQLDVHVLPGDFGSGQAWQVANTAAGWADLALRLGGMAVQAVGVEPSGGWERGVVGALVGAGLCVRLVEPGRVRAFACALGRHAKTDTLDAALIARFCQAVPGRSVELDEKASALAELVDARRALCEEEVRLGNQNGQLRDAMLRRLCKQRLARLKASRLLIEKRLAALVEADAQLAARNRLMRSVPGVGPVLAWTLLAHMPELGSLSHRQVAALAGVAPFDKQSGASRKAGRIRGARAQVRNAAYMGALTASRFNPALAAFAQHLGSKAKPAKVVLIAVTRKLLTILNAMIRNNTEWNQKPA